MLQHGETTFFQSACIDFSANMNFLGIPEPVMQAARSGLIAAMRTLQESSKTLEEHLAEWEGVEPEYVFCGNGAAEVVRSLLNAVRPKKALIPAPGFEEYIRALSMVQCSIEYYYTEGPKEYQIEQEDFCRHITEDIDVVFLCNPSNPTAVLYDKAFIREVLHKCEEVHALLIVDECSLDFVEDSRQRTMASKEASSSLFIVKSFTNLFALPGIRLGYGLCTDQEVIGKMKETVLQVVSSVAQSAGIACTKEREFVDRTAQETTRERRWLMGEFDRLGLSGARGEANYIFFPSRPGLHTFSILHGIMLRDCSNFEGLSDGYYRVAVRGREENRQLIEVLGEWQDMKK